MQLRSVPAGQLKHVHPCFDCGLSDCDDRHVDCGLRLALRAYNRLKSQGAPIPVKTRQAKNIAYHELFNPRRQERLQAAREAVRA